MGKGKLEKFAELETFHNVYQKPNGEDFKGKWHKHFGNNNPIILELACGKGDYSLALAKQFPESNFIGIDIKGNRIHMGASKAIDQKIDNVRFLRIFIDHIDEYFAQNEVSEIWITFPDPFLRKSKANKRLTSKKFLDLYKKIIQNKSSIHLKTDSPELFAYTQEVIAEHTLSIHEKIDNIYAQNNVNPILTDIQTYYEKKHLEDGRIIKYIRFSL